MFMDQNDAPNSWSNTRTGIRIGNTLIIRSTPKTKCCGKGSGQVPYQALRATALRGTTLPCALASRRAIIALRMSPRAQGIGVSYVATAASSDFCQRLFILIPLSSVHPFSAAVED